MRKETRHKGKRGEVLWRQGLSEQIVLAAWRGKRMERGINKHQKEERGHMEKRKQQGKEWKATIFKKKLKEAGEREKIEGKTEGLIQHCCREKRDLRREREKSKRRANSLGSWGKMLDKNFSRDSAWNRWDRKYSKPIRWRKPQPEEDKTRWKYFLPD